MCKKKLYMVISNKEKFISHPKFVMNWMVMTEAHFLTIVLVHFFPSHIGYLTLKIVSQIDI